MHANNCIPKCISQFLPPFDLYISSVTFNDLWGQSDIAYDAQGHHMGIHTQTDIPKYISKIWP